MKHAYLIIHPQLFIAVTTHFSAIFGNAPDNYVVSMAILPTDDAKHSNYFH